LLHDDRNRVGVAPRTVVAIGATVRSSVTGKVDGDDRQSERDDDRVPRVRVLTAAVQEHQLGIAASPYQHAHELVGVDLDLAPFDADVARPEHADLLRVLGEQCELVVGRVILLSNDSGHADSST
jgi:hypothetical protein